MTGRTPRHNVPNKTTDRWAWSSHTLRRCVPAEVHRGAVRSGATQWRTAALGRQSIAAPPFQGHARQFPMPLRNQRPAASPTIAPATRTRQCMRRCFTVEPKMSIPPFVVPARDSGRSLLAESAVPTDTPAIDAEHTQSGRWVGKSKHRFVADPLDRRPRAPSASPPIPRTSEVPLSPMHLHKRPSARWSPRDRRTRP